MVYIYIYIIFVHLLLICLLIAAMTLPAPLLCSDLSQSAKTDASVAALIAPEQDVYVVLGESVFAMPQRCVDVVSQLGKRRFEIRVSYYPLQVEWEVSQMQVGVRLPRNRLWARKPLSFPLGFPFAFVFCSSLRVEETVPGVHHEIMLVGRHACAVCFQHVLQQSAAQIGCQVPRPSSTQQVLYFFQQIAVAARIQRASENVKQ